MGEWYTRVIGGMASELVAQRRDTLPSTVSGVVRLAMRSLPRRLSSDMPRPRRPIRARRLPEQGPVPTGQAAVLVAQLDRELVRALGAVPLLVAIFERLGLREAINCRCHRDGTGTSDLDLGLLTLVLVLNRLLGPKPLVYVETWLAQTALPALLGRQADQLNDDRLARALDALVPQLDALWHELIRAAVVAFDLDLSRLVYDITSISFCGDYDAAEPVTFGYSRVHRPDHKQVELATTVTVAGGVPIDCRALAGNVAGRTTPVENLRRLQALLAALPARDPATASLVISDRAMLTLEAVLAHGRSNLRYLGRLDPRCATAPCSECAAASAPRTWRVPPLPIGPSAPSMIRAGTPITASCESWNFPTRRRGSRRSGCERWRSGPRPRRGSTRSCANTTSPAWRRRCGTWPASWNDAPTPPSP